MNEKLNRFESALVEAISRTMEGMAFTDIEVLKDQEGIDVFDQFEGKNKMSELLDNSIMWAILPLINPLTGSILIEVKYDYGQLISQALFGFENGDTSEEIIFDALAESLNTICGCFIKALIPPDKEYEIGFPTTGKGEYPRNGNSGVTMYFNVGGNTMKAVILGDDFQTADTGDFINQEMIK